MNRRASAAALLAACLIFVATTACSVVAGSSPTPTPEPTATPTATPVPSPTPVPTAIGPGTVRARIDASCRAGQIGSQLVVTFGGRAEGANHVTRVRLFLNGNPVEDTGPIFELTYEHTTMINVGGGTQNSFRVIAESNAGANASVQSIVRCPAASGPIF